MAQDVAILVENMYGRNTHTVVRLDDDEFLQARLFVGLNLVVDTFDDVLELHLTRHFRHDNCVEGIPLGNDLILLDDVAIVLVKRAAIRNVSGKENDTCGGVDEAATPRTRGGHRTLP